MPQEINLSKLTKPQRNNLYIIKEAYIRENPIMKPHIAMKLAYMFVIKSIVIKNKK